MRLSRRSTPPARPVVAPCPDREHGQAMVEFAAVLIPLVLLLVGIIQFGFLFAAYVGASNAAREAGRAATIYPYNPTDDQATNDLARCQEALSAAQSAFDDAVPGQFSGSCTTATGGGDLQIAYPDSGTCVATSRTGCRVQVTLTYRQPLFVPFIGQLLGADAQNRVVLTATVTMVIN